MPSGQVSAATQADNDDTGNEDGKQNKRDKDCSSYALLCGYGLRQCLSAFLLKWNQLEHLDYMWNLMQ